MRRISMDLKAGPSKGIMLEEGDSNFLIVSILTQANSLDAYLTRQEAEWLLKLLEMHVQERGYDD